MERKIGEVFEFDGKKLRVEKIKNGSCTGCYLYDKSCFNNKGVTGECVDDFREDNTDVIFKEVANEETK